MRSLFDCAEDLINLNSGTLSVTPRSVQEAVHCYTDLYNRNPALSLFDTWERLWKIQIRLAEFIGARAEDLYLRPNVTYAMNDFLLSLKLPAGSEILTTDMEYGAIVNILKVKAKRESLALRNLALPIHGDRSVLQSPEAFLDAILDQIGPRTSCLMISHVFTGNGMVAPLKELATETRRRGIVLAVDGAHGIGALPIDFSQWSHVDYYGGNLHKWFMGPKGTGFGWINPAVRDRLDPCFGGWTSDGDLKNFVLPIPFQKFAPGDQFACQWMISSTNNFSSFYALDEMFDFWKEHTPKKIWSIRRSLLEMAAIEIAQKTQWPSVSAKVDSPLCGPMIAFEIPDRLGNQNFTLMRNLIERERLQVAVTFFHDKWHIRLSPSVYNSESEIRKAAEVLGNLARENR